MTEEIEIEKVENGYIVSYYGGYIQGNIQRIFKTFDEIVEWIKATFEWNGEKED